MHHRYIKKTGYDLFRVHFPFFYRVYYLQARSIKGAKTVTQNTNICKEPEFCYPIFNSFFDIFMMASWFPPFFLFFFFSAVS